MEVLIAFIVIASIALLGLLAIERIPAGLLGVVGCLALASLSFTLFVVAGASPDVQIYAIVGVFCLFCAYICRATRTR